MRQEEAASLRFGTFTLDPQNGELRQDGEPVSLRPKATAVLVELATRAGSLVPHDELVGAAWGDDHVDEEAALHNAVRQIRKALGDTAADPAYVETVHRRGYRFVARVTPAGGPSDLAPPPPERDPAGGIPGLRPWTAMMALAALSLSTLFIWLATPSLPAEAGSILEAPTEVLRARTLIDSGVGVDVERGAEILREAAHNGGGSVAWSGLAAAEIRLGNLEAAATAAARTLELAPEDANAHRILGQIDLMEGRLDSAEGHLLRAMEFDRSSGRSQHAWALYQAATGDVARAVMTAEVATGLAPGVPVVRANLARFLLFDRQYERAIEVGRTRRQFGDPLSVIQQQMRETEQAAAWFLGDYAASRDASLEYAVELGATDEETARLRSLPAREGAEAALRWRIRYHSESAEPTPTAHAQVAGVHMQLGEVDRALAELELLVAGALPSNPAWIYDPRFESLMESEEMSRIRQLYREIGHRA